ncbi:MAG TPA: hypothetical protein VGV88_11370 [Candidatus Dormibacteraeota bacterium]|nr:hypothetical protein [Candidatus Dormibacteraeota bacterium]
MLGSSQEGVVVLARGRAGVLALVIAVAAALTAVPPVLAGVFLAGGLR